MTARLRAHLFDLEAEGVRAFRFRNLIVPFKQDVRTRWAALFEGASEPIFAGGDTAGCQLVQLFHPQTRIEDRDHFEKLVDCVSKRLGDLDVDRRTRQHLERLWGFLQRFSLNEESDQRPSDRAVATLLRIPRARLADLYETLGLLVRRCQSLLSGKVTNLHPGRRRSLRAEGDRHG